MPPSEAAELKAKCGELEQQLQAQLEKNKALQNTCIQERSKAEARIKALEQAAQEAQKHEKDTLEPLVRENHALASANKEIRELLAKTTQQNNDNDKRAKELALALDAEKRLRAASAIHVLKLREFAKQFEEHQSELGANMGATEETAEAVIAKATGEAAAAPAAQMPRVQTATKKSRQALLIERHNLQCANKQSKSISSVVTGLFRASQPHTRAVNHQQVDDGVGMNRPNYDTFWKRKHGQYSTNGCSSSSTRATEHGR